MKNFFNPWFDPSIRDRNLSRFYREHVVERAPVEPMVADTYLVSALPWRRGQILFWLLLAGLAVLVVRSFYLQVIHGNEYLLLADRNRTYVEYIPAARGLIYDVDATSLVNNEPNFIISIIPDELNTTISGERAETLKAVAQEVQINPDQLMATIAEYSKRYSTQPYVVEDFIPHDRALELMSTFRQRAGVRIEAQPSRRYLTSPAFAHVLGYVGKMSPEDLAQYTEADYTLSDTLGKTGLERYYEETLRGIRGERDIETNVQGQATDRIAETPPIPGRNLILSIDSELQNFASDALERTSTAIGSPGGAVVAIDPHTGKIRALVSYPSFDNNTFVSGISQEEYTALAEDERKPLFNKAISGEYPSGSTFKLIVAAAALQEGVVNEQTVVNSTGGIKLDKLYPDWKAGGHGSTTITKALAESVNTYFYLAGGGEYDPTTKEITGGLGIDRIQAYATKFGLGSTTGIDLTGEAKGLVPSREWKKNVKGEDWYLGDTYIVSIGQGDLLVTPLQLALSTTVVANGGIVYQPSMVERMTNQNGETVLTVEPKIIQTSFVDPKHFAVIRKGMREAVQWGSARRINTLPVASAGKTGTAQIGGNTKTHSWYTTFLPYDDPNLVLTVLVEEGGEGSEAALSVAKEVLMAYLKP